MLAKLTSWICRLIFEDDGFVGADDGDTPEKIEVDGKEYTQDELTEAMRGNMRLSDYTSKTQSHAEEVAAHNTRVAEWEAEKAKGGNSNDDNTDNGKVMTEMQKITARLDAQENRSQLDMSMTAIEDDAGKAAVANKHMTEVLDHMKQEKIRDPLKGVESYIAQNLSTLTPLITEAYGTAKIAAEAKQKSDDADSTSRTAKVSSGGGGDFKIDHSKSFGAQFEAWDKANK